MPRFNQLRTDEITFEGTSRPRDFQVKSHDQALIPRRLEEYPFHIRTRGLDGKFYKTTSPGVSEISLAGDVKDIARGYESILEIVEKNNGYTRFWFDTSAVVGNNDLLHGRINGDVVMVDTISFMAAYNLFLARLEKKYSGVERNLRKFDDFLLNWLERLVQMENVSFTPGVVAELSFSVDSLKDVMKGIKGDGNRTYSQEIAKAIDYRCRVSRITMNLINSSCQRDANLREDSELQRIKNRLLLESQKFRDLGGVDNEILAYAFANGFVTRKTQAIVTRDSGILSGAKMLAEKHGIPFAVGVERAISTNHVYAAIANFESN